MQVSFWPDYDEPLVLVLLTGLLPADTILPAQVTIPVPADARLHAVAALADAGMVTIEYEIADGAVTFAAPESGFRIEYYVPYQVDGNTHSYSFSWLSDLDIAEFTAEIQQPANATNLGSDPAAVSQFTGQTDGLVYHVLPATAVGAGQPYKIDFRYDMPVDALTAPPAAAAPQGVPAPAAAVSTEASTNWILIGAGGLGVLALAIGGTWYLTTRKQTSASTNRPKKPAPSRPAKVKPSQQAARFCHVCGQAAEPSDQFCRSCGTQLKR